MSANQTFGKYTLIKKLATGGMAEVWLAKQVGIEGFNRHVVVKRILPHLAEDPEFVQMFLNEAKIAARFNHPNIAQIYDLGENDGQYYIAMEFIHGEDLGRVMRRAWSTGQWVARHITLRVMADACQGLYYAHTRNDEQGRPLRVVHRDISPQNILISFDGAVKVVDFGIAKASDQVSNTKSGAIKGKFAYMAPEQASGKPLDARSDLFALGLVLYELVTGVRPLKRDSELATLQAALECKIDPPSVVADVPPELDHLVMRALAKAPDDRYTDAREFQRALEQYLMSTREMATSAEVSELMAALFADRLGEEARLGAPNPSTESSTSNPVAPPYGAAPQSVTHPPPARGPVRASPSMTLDDEATLGPDEGQNDPPADDAPGPAGRAYELPPGTVVPSRAYGKRGTENVRAFRPDAAPPDEEDGAASPRRPLRRKTATGQASALREDAEPRRRGTGQIKRRTSSALAMPEAPPRTRSKVSMPEPPRPSENISALVDVAGMRQRQRARLRALVSVLVLLGSLVLLFVFKDSLLGLLKRSNLSEDGVPVRLTVHTNPPVTQVTIIPAPGVKNRRPLELGRSPIDEQSGAYVGDTVLLENPDRGIRVEHRIEYGEPNGIILIHKEFKESAVRIRTKPARLTNASVWRGAFKLGQVGVNLSLYPGTHELEIRADQLANPHPFSLQFADGAANINWEVDVTSSLDKK